MVKESAGRDGKEMACIEPYRRALFFECMPAAYLNRKAGRKFTMAAAGVMFEIGGIILAAAMNYEMLVIGRCFLGVAVSVIPSHVCFLLQCYVIEQPGLHSNTRTGRILQSA